MDIKKLTRHLSLDKRKSFILAGIVAVLAVFIAILLSLGGDQDEGQQAAAPGTPRDSAPASPQVPVKERYDFERPAAPEPPPTPATGEAMTAEPAPGQPAAAPQAMLFCERFANDADAQERKARIAFIGVRSEVAPQDGGGFILKVGPFASRDEARAAFKRLADAGLTKECRLEDVRP
ncbi:MAG: SPOR domain-containing protein [Succinivibrionaceae bacterium]|nr:SPOR domain-containing protein [Succinivibrionaceae bacterium]